jgi:hypothetical protein
MRSAALLPLVLLVACKPPAADDYVARVGVAERAAPLPPIVTPDTAGAGWAPSSANPRRLVYGKPGQRVLFALECNGSAANPRITYTRFADADPHAKAILALVGNGHVSRLKIDATRQGNRWLWRGSEPAASLNFEGLTGARQVEATVPGAGSLILNPSPLPGDLILQCRALIPPATPMSAPAAVAAPGLPPPDTTDTAVPPPPPAR